MDNWEDFFNNLLENSKQEFNTFCEQLGKDWQKTTSDLEKNLGDFAEEVETLFTEELTGFINEVDILMDGFLSLLIDDDLSQRINQDRDNNNSNYPDFMVWFEEQKVEPNSQVHPACINCANYHGRVYNGNLLVCGMHPYGWNDENCPDWEAKNENN